MMKKKKMYPPIGFGERLTLLMDERNINACELAEIIGCERKSIYAYRNNEVPMNITMLMKLCSFFHVTTDFMIYGK